MNKFFIAFGAFLILAFINVYKLAYNDALLDISEKSLSNIKSLETPEDATRFMQSLKCSTLALDMLK